MDDKYFNGLENSDDKLTPVYPELETITVVEKLLLVSNLMQDIYRLVGQYESYIDCLPEYGELLNSLLEEQLEAIGKLEMLKDSLSTVGERIQKGKEEAEQFLEGFDFEEGVHNRFSEDEDFYFAEDFEDFPNEFEEFDLDDFYNEEYDKDENYPSSIETFKKKVRQRQLNRRQSRPSTINKGVKLDERECSYQPTEAAACESRRRTGNRVSSPRTHRFR